MEAAYPNDQATTGADAPAGRRMATTAATLGIVSLAIGFALVPLMAAVVAITMGSLGLQAVSEGRADPSTAGRFRTAIGCGVAALCIWIPVAVVTALVNA